MLIRAAVRYVTPPPSPFNKYKNPFQGDEIVGRGLLGAAGSYEDPTVPASVAATVRGVYVHDLPPDAPNEALTRHFAPPRDDRGGPGAGLWTDPGRDRGDRGSDRGWLQRLSADKGYSSHLGGRCVTLSSTFHARLLPFASDEQ